jgi:hypothetical protein
MNFSARLFAGYPGRLFAFAVSGKGELAVEGERGFQGYEGRVCGDPASEGFVESLRWFFEDTCFDFDFCSAQTGKTGASGLGIRIFHGGYDATDASGDESFSAGASSALVITRFECNVGSGSASAFACLSERDYFRVIEFVVDVKTFTNNCTVFDEDAADWGIGTGQANGLAREAERMFHEVLIVGIHGLVEQRIGVGLGVERN